MKYIASPFIAFISLFGIHTASGQLAVISDQNINFSNGTYAISVRTNEIALTKLLIINK
jgi:hypothetical protein